MTGATTQSVPKATVISSGVCQLSNAPLAQLGEFKARNEPSRAIVKLTPKAKLSSLPLNHFAMAQVTETISDSAPMPKISRPVAMMASWPDAAVIAAPIRHKTPNSSVAFLTPIRSMMMPPMRTMKTLGTL